MRQMYFYLIFFIILLLFPCDFCFNKQHYILQFPANIYQKTDLAKYLLLKECLIIHSYQPLDSQNIWLEIQPSQPALLPQLISELRQKYHLNYLEPAYPSQLAATPNDPYFVQGAQDYFQRLDIKAAWESQAGKNTIKVAVIDTGIDTIHPDLEHFFQNKGETSYDLIDNDQNGYIDDVRGWDFINQDNNPEDDNGHGTHVAGIIGATTNNGLGIAGAAGGGFNIKGKPQTGVILIPLKTANENNQHGSNLLIAQAIDLAVSYGAKVINLSLQTTAVPPVEEDPLYQSISRAANKGVVIVAAAGNTEDPEYANLDNWSAYNLLAKHPHVISVTATEVIKGGRVKIAVWQNSEGKSTYACYGNAVKVSAPGKDILSCVPTSLNKQELYKRFSGTSMAAAVVSGAASLVVSKNYRLNGQQVMKILQASAMPLYVYGGGSGEINFERALLLTPDILEPFVEVSQQLQQGFPQSYLQRAQKTITLSPKPVNTLKESEFYDLRIALLADYYQKQWTKAN